MSDIGPVSLDEVLLVLNPRLNSLAAAPKESRFGKVWVGAVEDARGLAFRHVFVPGLNEGLFHAFFLAAGLADGARARALFLRL